MERSMRAASTTECPLCRTQAVFEQVDLWRKHYRCSRCTEFVLWKNAESRLRKSAVQTLERFSVAASQTTDPLYIYVIQGHSDDAPPHVDLQGAAVQRLEALR
jgi:hypothetical protein